MSIKSRTTNGGPVVARWTARRSLAAIFAVLAGTAAVTVVGCNDSPTQPAPVGVIIGPAGGTVTLDDVSLVIPAGALTEPTDVVIESLADDPFATDEFYIGGTAHRIKPTGLALSGSGATLTIRYNAGNTGANHEEHLRIQERETLEWREMAQNRVRMQERAVEGLIQHFGTFGVVGADPAKLVVASVTVEPTSLALALAETGQLVATAFCEHDMPLDRVFTWSSDAASVATVDAAGLVTGVAEGDAIITADIDGVSATAAVTVAGTVAEVIVSPASFSMLEGDTQQLTAVAQDAGDHVLVRTFTWSSGNEAVATVDANGLVTAVLPGSAVISAMAEGVTGSAAAEVDARIVSITVSPSTFDIATGDEVQLSAVALDARGAEVVTDFVWTSSDESVATVDATGLVTGVNDGNVTISAAAGGQQGGAGGSARRVLLITIDNPSDEPLGAGLTRQLTSTAYDANSNVVNAKFIWESSAPSVASVDATGLVTGVARGLATISASVKTGASASVEIRVIPGGGDEEIGGNNMSWPVVFAEGIGITGSPVATDPGVRPLTTEANAYAEYLTIPVTNPMAEYFYSGNTANVLTYYLQATANTWRAQFVDGTGQPRYDASAYWGDNLAGTGNLAVDHPIRVEVALSTTDGVSLLGFNMPYVANPSSPNEVQGTDGTTAPLIPLIYTAGPTLTIEQLDGPGGSVIATVSSAVFKAELNVGGRLIYGAQFRPTVAGTYRLRYTLATGANVRLTAANVGTVSPTEAAIEIQVTP